MAVKLAKIDYFLTFEEIRETGLLMEANRQFFHPRGFALAIETNENGDTYIRVLDYREESGGVLYDESIFEGLEEEAQRKASFMQKLLEERLEERVRLGCDKSGMQPLPKKEEEP